MIVVELHFASPCNRDATLEKCKEPAERVAQFLRAFSHETWIHEYKISGNEIPDSRESLICSCNRKATHQRIDLLSDFHPQIVPLRQGRGGQISTATEHGRDSTVIDTEGYAHAFWRTIP